ncbi:cytochrome c550 [Exiguobacterium flavidum]|uniref:cytochrome c550 n=1 Tax=Exiguobacterium flavidum TaxID=2184695 RepID=UPI000DF74648|nr:cytochrome c [Exiguobacterium flavidum]
MRNPLVPFATIAIIAIIAMVSLSYFGVNQVEQAKNKPATEQLNPEELLAAKGCTGCHGGKLEGGAGPNLTKVGAKLKEEDIKNIIVNGKGAMPAGLANEDEAGVLAKWLAEKK